MVKINNQEYRLLSETRETFRCGKIVTTVELRKSDTEITVVTSNPEWKTLLADSEQSEALEKAAATLLTLGFPVEVATELAEEILRQGCEDRINEIGRPQGCASINLLRLISWEDSAKGVDHWLEVYNKLEASEAAAK